MNVPDKVRGWTFMVCTGQSGGWGVRRGPIVYGLAMGKLAVSVMRVDAEALIVEGRRHMTNAQKGV